MARTTYALGLDANGHWLVSSGPTGKPVAVFYAHNVPDRTARLRAEAFIKAMK